VGHADTFVANTVVLESHWQFYLVELSFALVWTKTMHEIPGNATGTVFLSLRYELTKHETLY